MTTDPVVGGLVMRPAVRLILGEPDHLFGVGPVEVVVRHVDRVVWYAGRSGSSSTPARR